MKTFISQLTLLLLILNGNMVGMQHTIKFLAYNNQRFYSLPLTVKNEQCIKNKINNTQEIINSKDKGDKQEAYIHPNIPFDPKEDKMAYYKKWQKRQNG